MKFYYAICVLSLFAWTHVFAQKKVTLKVSPDPIIVEVGKTLKLDVKAVDENDNTLPDSKCYFFPIELKGVQENLIFTGGLKVDERRTNQWTSPRRI